jgi:hypothetical protein
MADSVPVADWADPESAGNHIQAASRKEFAGIPVKNSLCAVQRLLKAENSDAVSFLKIVSDADQPTYTAFIDPRLQMPCPAAEPNSVCQRLTAADAKPEKIFSW